MIRSFLGSMVVGLYTISSVWALEVAGNVIDELGPIPGVSVYCQDTTIGTMTDADGNFSIENIPNNCLLDFSHIGYTTQTYPITTSNTNISITLEEGATQLEEIIIIACNSSQVRVYNSYSYNDSACVEKIQCESGLQRKTITTLFPDPDDPDDPEFAEERVSGQECVDPEYDGGATNPKDPGYGIRCDMTTLLHGNCGMDVYNMLGIRQSNPDTTPDEFVQDIVLTATTFIGTILTFALVVSALMIIFGGANESTASRGRQGIKYALIGYVLVLCSYLIIRLVQYIAG